MRPSSAAAPTHPPRLCPGGIAALVEVGEVVVEVVVALVALVALIAAAALVGTVLVRVAVVGEGEVVMVIEGGLILGLTSVAAIPVAALFFASEVLLLLLLAITRR